jgi:hypothetical protein
MEVDGGEITENRKLAIVTELPFLKIEPYCIPPSGGMVHRKRGIKKGLLRWTISPHITLEEGPIWKDQTVQINSIPPQPAPVVWGDMHRWYGWYGGKIGNLSQAHNCNI